jgi:hypothetical protein
MAPELRDEARRRLGPERRVPMVLRTRPWTPDRREGRPGEECLVVTTRRACNGCGVLLGDATEDEDACMVLGHPLPDVRDECPFCQRSAARNA